MGEMQGGYRINSVTFGEQWIEIGYFEPRDVSDKVVTIKQILISPTLFPQEFGEILDELANLIDLAATHRRNPVTEFRAPRQPPSASEEPSTHDPDGHA